MKKLALAVIVSMSCVLVNAQDQFTNFGNFRMFTGAEVSFFGNFANNGTFTDAGQTVTLKGTSVIPISGATITTFSNLVVDNAAGVALQQDVIIGTSLVLTSGPFDLNLRTLTINNAASTALSRTSGYILSEQTNNSGKVKWNIGTNTDPHIFPFGTAAGAYIPFTLSVATGDIGNVTVSTYPTASDNTPYPTSPETVTNVNRAGVDNSANVVDRFWQIDKDVSSGTATLTFTATPAEIGSISTLLAQRWDASNSVWEDPLPNQVSTATGVTVPDVSTFSPWTLSSSNALLPIELIDFTASARGQNVDLNWRANTEINNHYFTIQRSRDGILFSDIGKISGAGTSYISTKYKYTDTNVLQGRWYYRLMQTDFDGKSKTFEIKRVDIETTFTNDFVVHPNPVSDKFTFRGVSQYQITAITVLNGQGTPIGVLDYELSDGMYSGNFDLSTNVPGLYIIKIGHDHGSDYLKIIKQ